MSDALRITAMDDSAITTDYQPTKLTLNYSGKAEIIFAKENTMRIRGKGTGIKIFNDIPCGKHIIEMDDNFVVAQMGGQYLQLGVRMLTGTLKAEQDWNGQWSPNLTFNLLPDENGDWEVELIDYHTPYYYKVEKVESFDVLAKRVDENFRKFYQNTPEVPEQFEELREFAAYVNWSCVIAPLNFMKRYGMLMSKNWMCNIWSWDHCFNAMALIGGDVNAAWDQMMMMFDHMDCYGALPDMFNDTSATRLNVKPPVHGWAFGKMMDYAELSLEQLEEARVKLARWTNWWTQLRVGRNGFPCYYHGNDSGWDNSTAFLPVMPVTTPELIADLIMQMRTLARICNKLGRTAEEKEWNTRADDYKKALIEKFWNGSELVYLDGKGEQHTSTSLLPLLTIILGEELPQEIKDYIVGKLLTPAEAGGFLTDWGIMTEQLNSGYYLPDGYWRGPIWAPSTMICIDGLYRAGYKAEAKMLALKFAELCNKGGFAENFNALTGEGLRDRAYTWTSSVFLILMRDYLD
jgi:glycogen debranching enzyme